MGRLHLLSLSNQIRIGLFECLIPTSHFCSPIQNIDDLRELVIIGAANLLQVLLILPQRSELSLKELLQAL